MAVEAGARGALIAPDEKAIEYVFARASDITEEHREDALNYWATLRSDKDADFEIEYKFDAQEVVPYVTWGTSPDQAESEGITQILIDAGFEWRKPGCSMCLAMNDDVLEPGIRCASSTNRNFEGRQGRGAITHLMSPAMAAAAAVTDHITDVRKLGDSNRKLSSCM